jgi:DNA replication initiation complex subunit (GINS family)
MTLTLLNKVQWTETLQSGLRLSSLPEYFYPKLRRYVGDLKERAVNDAAASHEHRQAEKSTTDIVNCRIRKLVNLAASSSSAGSILRDLSREERALYEQLHASIIEWKANVV